jgi:hypothetical protein
MDSAPEHMIVLHVTRGFSAEPTLSGILSQEPLLAGCPRVVELPFAQALTTVPAPELIWVSTDRPYEVQAVRDHFPHSSIMATTGREAPPETILLFLASGADLVIRDEGVTLAAVALRSLARSPRLTPLVAS